MNFQKSNELRVKHLSVTLIDKKTTKQVLNDVSLIVKKGLITALVGESGSGKTMTALAMKDLLPSSATIIAGEIVNATKNTAMIFQDPTSSLDPLFKVGHQLVETIYYNHRCTKKAALKEAVKLLQDVHLENPSYIMNSYPFELSGGMCQRVMIAIAMAMKSDFLIADEPTTALDVTVQSKILKEIYDLSRKQQVGVLFITHDLGVVAEIADYVYVMKSGIIVEEGNTLEIFETPKHNYTKELIAAIY